jgi:hypothetical protein
MQPEFKEQDVKQEQEKKKKKARFDWTFAKFRWRIAAFFGFCRR